MFEDDQLLLPPLTVRFQANRIGTHRLRPLCILSKPAIRLRDLPNSVKEKRSCSLHYPAIDRYNLGILRQKYAPHDYTENN